ncbi:dihydrofolate reductase family protein [Lishizhenia sp.]|uniref:dihydrofolate reductase family protein n=1 Tax=Lishizhenia sp. TaxID=2497594 RepID=UPI00299CE70C|nr:dihydrofolate reductase family protein [Lishizhenia sp.]MDX1447169.1 dihydrofolate reductase family protein [Lishizhenia sp.]
MERKVVLYISSSLDGFIAKPNDDLSFLNPMTEEGEDYGYADFTRQIDTVIVGRKTYDWVVKEVGFFPHKDKESYVITTQEKPQEGLTHFYNGDLTTLIQSLKAKEGKNIYCDGGAQLVNSLLKADLLDEIILSIIPVTLGEGVSLFENEIPERRLELKATKAFKTGLVQLHYQVNK